jgi:hypothetical protein
MQFLCPTSPRLSGCTLHLLTFDYVMYFIITFFHPMVAQICRQWMTWGWVIRLIHSFISCRCFFLLWKLLNAFWTTGMLKAVFLQFGAPRLGCALYSRPPSIRANTLMYTCYVVLNFYPVQTQCSCCWDEWNYVLLKQGYKYGMSQLKYKSGKSDIRM